MHESSLILKQDVLGRVRVTAERRAALVAEFRRSGLSGYRFARLSGVKYPTLMAWVKRAAHGVADPGPGPHPAAAGGRQLVKARPLKLVEAVVDRTAAKSPALMLDLGGGVRMALTDAGQLTLAAQLIQALQRPC
jgi:transposase-like protein